MNKKNLLLGIFLVMFYTNVHGANNEWAFLLNPSDVHLVASDVNLKNLKWFTKTYKFNTFCNASFFASSGAVGTYITNNKIKVSNRYNWWWIGWDCKKAIMSNKSLLDVKMNLNYIVCGTPALIRKDKLVTEKEMLESCSRSFFNRKCARTAIGIVNDKIFIYITMSATIPELQQRMQSFGCSYALNLDGGGSTFITSKNIRFPKKIKRSYPNLLAW